MAVPTYPLNNLTRQTKCTRNDFWQSQREQHGATWSPSREQQNKSKHATNGNGPGKKGGTQAAQTGMQAPRDIDRGVSGGATCKDFRSAVIQGFCNTNGLAQHSTPPPPAPRAVAAESAMGVTYCPRGGRVGTFFFCHAFKITR
eukprot:2755660-Amphidinium_carterae.1